MNFASATRQMSRLKKGHEKKYGPATLGARSLLATAHPLVQDIAKPDPEIAKLDRNIKTEEAKNPFKCTGYHLATKRNLQILRELLGETSLSRLDGHFCERMHWVKSCGAASSFKARQSPWYLTR